MSRLHLTLLALCAALPAAALPAQAPAADTVAIDAAVARARRAAGEGNTAEARRVLDSLARAGDAASPRLPEVLFWRATYAATAADAERDYRRLVVEHPASARAEDALLRLAQLEMARGDQQLAVRHLERLVLEHPESPNRARARYWMGRAHFDAGEPAKACAALGQSLATAAPGDVELRNQVTYAGQRCPKGWDVVKAPAPVAVAAPATKPAADTARWEPLAGDAPAKPVTTDTQQVAATRAAAATGGGAPPTGNMPPKSPPTVTDSPRVVPPTPAPSVAAPARPAAVDTPRVATPRPPVPAPATPAATKPTAPTTTAPGRSMYAVQLAAYDTRAEAETLVRRLAGRGVTARVSGDAKPFRVRTGRYATRAEAARQLAALKAKGLAGFVAEEPASP